MRWNPTAVVAACGAGILLTVGCGGDATKPEPDVKVLAGILIDRDMPAGAPYQAAAVVSVDGKIVTDAEVEINGIGLVYVDDPGKPEATGFVGAIPASEGDVLALSATAAGRTVTLEATVPGLVGIHSPVSGDEYADDQDIPVSWNPAAGTMLTIITCGSADATTPGMWLVTPSTTAHAIPASATTVPGSRITVMGMSGTGDLPSTKDLRQWAGKSGFWITSEDYIDVIVTG